MKTELQRTLRNLAEMHNSGTFEWLKTFQTVSGSTGVSSDVYQGFLD